VIRRVDVLFSNKHLLWGLASAVLILMLLPGVFGLGPPHWLSDGPDPATNSEQAQQATDMVIADSAKDAMTGTAADATSQTTASPAQPAQPTGPIGNDVATKPKPAAEVPPVLVERRFHETIPDSHLGLESTDLKDSFIGIVLPLIIAANDEILTRRMIIRHAASRGDRETLERWADEYGVEIIDQDDDELTRHILLHADVIPVALALTQAAVESGWGMSRFARDGNALFGQWAWRKTAGLKPLDASDDRAVVRSFPHLLGSVRAYMHNLNTHPRYEEFRLRRAALADENESSRAFALAVYLDGYAEIGDAYVEKLHEVMLSNDFDRFAGARFE
jgi:uncharacterized FlgJ-related protein